VADTQLLGLFTELEPAAESIRRLHELHISDEQISVLSGEPFKSEMLARPKPRHRVARIALLGSVLGISLGLFLSVGVFLLFPIHVGGQPIVPIPPTLIVLFETTMLGTMWASFFGLIAVNRFPVFKRQIYDSRISEGYIGVAVTLGEGLVDQVRGVFQEFGAEDVVKAEPDERTDKGFRIFWAGFFVTGAVLTVLTGLWAYNIIQIPFPSQMVSQESVAYLQGPRKAAPADAVPINGPVLIDGQPATTPQPATADSIARGAHLFSLTCAVCHGASGNGVSTVGAFFGANKPADLTGSDVQSLSDQDIYLVITNGFGVMPSMAENLDKNERWDVINFVRTLKK
jgi:mono/diheme cytochrome c family protein